VRTYRGTNIDSDHFLVLTSIRSRTSNVKKFQGDKSIKLNCEKLNSDDFAQMKAHKVGEYLVDAE
jgi:hypothetical protein